MPLGDQKHKLIYRELVNALGEQYVQDDPAVVECYRREAQSPPSSTPMNCEFIVFPGSTEDVQQIVRLANRYLFPYSISSTGTLGAHAAALKPYWVWIDPKRMNSLEIDAENMCAIVQPYVTHAQVSLEARKVGLFNGAPSAGAQTSCLANTVALGMQTAAYKTGRASRNLLGVEWVLPNGNILRTGSLAMPGDRNFWGEGPGPDLRGLLRGHAGHQGSLGVVTKIALKLFPWPGPAVLPAKGAIPRKQVVLPEDTFRWHLIRFRDVFKGIEAMREISKCEIAHIVAMFGPWNMAHHFCKSREEHTKLFEEERFFHKMFKFVVVVGIWGVTSKSQVQYEEEVLADITKDFDGEEVEREVQDMWTPFVAVRNIIDPLAARTQRIPMGVPEFTGGGIAYDSLSDAYRNIPAHLPEIALWVIPFDLGHFGMVSTFSEPPSGEKSTDQEKRMGAYSMKGWPDQLAKQISDSTIISASPHFVGPLFHTNIHFVLGDIKKTLDPNNVANPGRVINLEAIEKLKAAAEAKKS